MRWFKLLDRYSLVKKPKLKVVNARIGTSIIPLDVDDTQILFQYLTNRLHSLTFEGTEHQFLQLLNNLKLDKGLTLKKMKSSPGRGKEKLVLVHLESQNNIQIRRLIKFGPIA